MIVLDSYAVLALLEGEPAAPHVRALLEADDDACLTARWWSTPPSACARVCSGHAATTGRTVS